jgi:hypothetical protein
MNKSTYGFNTFCTRSHLPLVQVLADSICQFSKYPITINCLNFKYDFNHPKIISKTIDTNKIYNLNCIYRHKWSTLLDSDYDITTMLDADMVVLPDIDQIFEDNKFNIADSQVPLFAKHPHNPFDNPMHSDSLYRMMAMITSNKPKMPYVYASGLIHKNHLYFVKNLVDIIDWFVSNNINPYIEDEGLLNCLLSKYEIAHSLDYNYFPNYTLYNDYITNTIDTSNEMYNTYTRHACPVKFYAFHGCKDPSVARLILDQVSNSLKLSHKI